MKKITLFLVAITMSLFSFAQIQMSGTYTVGTGGSYDYSSMADAGMAIKDAEFTGDVTLLICTDLTETINTGIVNKSEYTLTIRPDKDENRTITYTTATDNTGPTGVFVIGGDMTKTPGSTIGWASVPTKNVVVDGAAEGKTTPRLKITNEKWGTNVILYGDVQDVVIRNCILIGRSSSTAYALVFRSENYSKTSKDIAPKNCLVENCILQSSSPSSQTVYFQGNQANSVAGWPASITIRNSTIKAHTRGIYVRQVCNLNVEGCTFDMSNSSGGILAHAIMGEGARGTINVKGNKFIKNSTANYHGGTYGLQTITASGGADVWVIENNYFAGYDALKAISNTTNGTEARLVAVRCGDYCEVRHNTFHMPNLTKDQASKLVSASPTTLLWLAGSHKYPVQNNIFVCEETTANVSLIRGGLNENVTGNVFYHKGGNAAIVAAAPSCMTFADLETSYSAQAATSKWTNVTFTDVANGDLSLAGASDGDANLAVDRLAEVLTDINGKARREKTYAGAYEGGEFPAEVCKVDVTVTPVGSGTVEGAGECAKGSDVTLTPKPNTGYEFTGWTFEDETTSTDNPLIITVDGDKNITANFAKKQYTLTVLANDDAKGDVTGNGTYEYGTEVEITATPKSGFEFTGWSNGSKENPLTISMEEDTELTANFRAILASSITLNAHPVKDYTASIVGTMKRAIQNGENTIVLTHEANGTAHIYNIAHATKTVNEISQEGVNAAADGFLSISDIAVTEDGKLVACNYVHCTFTPSNTSYFYIWNDLAAAPSVWFTSQKSGNYNDAYMGYTMALKGTSQNAEVTISAFNKSNSNTRYSHLYVVDGTYSDASYKYSRDNAALHPNTLGKNTYELNASPLAAGKWIVDGELASPIEFVEKNAVAIDTYTALNINVLGKKYNGASYLFYNDHHLMIAPYATDDKLAGVKVLGITDGFGSPVQVETNTVLLNAIDATTAAATAYVDGDGDLTIYLIADGKVYTFSEKVYTAQTFTVTANAGEGGTVEGGGPYEENTTATLTATPAEHYDFMNWTYGSETSTDNPLIITVNSDMTITANFQEHTKYTITAVPNDENMGTVIGGGTYYAGESATLKATAQPGYVFAGWTDGEKNATRIVEVSADVTYTANFQAIAPRAWAYDLKVAENGDKYEFTFKATAAGSATLLFADIDGNELVAPHAVGTVAAGVNTVTLAKTTFEGVTKDVYWSVKMDGEAIPAISEITDASKGIYNFYLPQGVAVDNNTESSTFSKIYIAESTDGASDGGSDRADNQKRGIFIYDQTLAELNPTNKGIIPSNVTLTNTTRNALKRIAINPKTNEVAFAYNASPAAVWAVSTENVAGEATNLLEGLGFEYCNSLCFDENGILYIFDNGAGYPAKGSLYKIVNGEKITIFSENSKYGNADNSLASDGRGGLWIYQNRGQLDAFNQLSHINANGEIDFEVNSTTPHDFASLNTSRGAMAYNPRENILAIGIGASGTIGVSLYQVTYDPSTGVPSLEYIGATPSLGKNVEGIAFDYAGDLYALSANAERFYKFTLPTADNICIVPAPSSQKLVLGTQCEVTVTVNDPAMGSVEGAGQYEKGATVELEATANEHYQFVNWTKGEEVLSAENPYSFTAEDVTITANFAELPKYTITVQANNEAMGSVDGGGTVHVGESVEIKAIPNSGHAFVKWDDGNTEATRTVEVDGNKTYTAIFQAMIPRAWAYDLRMVEDGDNYKFTFKATSAGTATLLFTNKAGTSVAPNSYAVGSVEAGEKSVTIAKSEFGGTEDIYWSLQMDGDAIENMIEITDVSKGIYDIVAPQGIAVDNNTDSKHFGQVYVAAATDGTVSRGAQTRGIFVYDPILNELNSPNAGYLPANATLTSNTRQAIHRVAVNPTNSQVAFAYNISGSTAVWSMNPENLAGDAVNLIDGAGITKANSICFDENGILYVMDNANTGTGGKIYKIQNGVGDVFADAQAGNLWAVEDNAMTSDGRGGLWIAQNRWSVDGYPVLSHVNSNGQVDFAVSQNSSAELQALFPYDDNNASYRGQCAYYVAEDILAFAGNKEAVLFKITYDVNDVPTNLEKLMSTGKLGTNIDGLAFDYAGDLYVASETTHRMYKFVIPTADNTCTVPAPESQAIKLETRYTVTVVANDDAMGTASNGGEYTAGETITLTATAKDGYRFINWTKGAEVLSAETSFTYTVPAENVTIVANFEALPTITYELNGGVWNKYGWTSKKDMYNALLDDWRAYSGSTRTNVSYEEQLGIGNSSKGIPTTIYYTEDRLALQALFTDATYAPKWGWLATYVDAVAVAQSKATQPTTAAGNLVYALGNFFGEDNVHATDWMGAVDFTGEEAHLTAFAPYWGQTFPLPTQPTEEIVLNAPYKERYEFDGWYTTSDFSGAAVTTVDENTDGTLYAKWIEHFYTRTVTNGNIGTICLPYGSSSYSGAEFYEIAYLELQADGVTPKGIWLDEVTGALEAGKPYIFKATSTLLIVNYEGDEELNPVAGKAGLTGTFEAIPTTNDILEGNYMIAQNMFWLCSTGCWLDANRAYIEHDALHASTTPVSPMPGRRRVYMGGAGENSATGTEDMIVPNQQVQKVIENGQLIIIRDGEKYNVQGVRL